MNEKPLEEAMEDVARAAEEAVQQTEEPAEEAAAKVAGAVEEVPEPFEEKMAEVVGEVGNILARNIAEDPEADSNDRLWGLLAYISQFIVPLIVPVLMLVLEPNKDRPFQRYHAVQSLGFLVAEIIYEILAGIVFSVLTVITLGCLGLVLWVLFVLPVIPAIYYGVLAYQGKRFEIPYLTKFMRQQGWL